MDHKRAGTRGKIYVTANSVSQSNDMAKMNIVCRIVEPMKKEKQGFLCFCKPPIDNPWLRIERQGPQDDRDHGKINWMRVQDTDVYEGNLNPEFKKIHINMFKLCNSQRSCPLRFSLYSKQLNGKDILYGTCEVTCKELEKQNVDRERELINEKSKIRLAGTIQFSTFEIVE